MYALLDFHEERINLKDLVVRDIFLEEIRRETVPGGEEATRSGTEKRCSHNLQSGQSAG